MFSTLDSELRKFLIQRFCIFSFCCIFCSFLDSEKYLQKIFCLCPLLGGTEQRRRQAHRRPEAELPDGAVTCFSWFPRFFPCVFMLHSLVKTQKKPESLLTRTFLTHLFLYIFIPIHLTSFIVIPQESAELIMKQDLVAIIAELAQVEATITLQVLSMKFVKQC